MGMGKGVGKRMECGGYGGGIMRLLWSEFPVSVLRFEWCRWRRVVSVCVCRGCALTEHVRAGAACVDMVVTSVAVFF